MKLGTGRATRVTGNGLTLWRTPLLDVKPDDGEGCAWCCDGMETRLAYYTWGAEAAGTTDEDGRLLLDDLTLRPYGSLHCWGQASGHTWL